MAKDPYKYFRIEARELLDGLKQGALDLEKGQSSKELVARMLRLAHTLKGAARVVRLPAIAEQAHVVEDALEPYREGGRVPPQEVNQLLALVDAATGATATIAIAPDDGASPQPPQQQTSPSVETVRVEIDEMDRLLEGVTETTVRLGALRRETAAIERAARLADFIVERLARTQEGRGPSEQPAVVQLRADLAQIHQSVATTLEQASAELSQVRDAANRLRLSPVSMVLATLERAARDVAYALEQAHRVQDVRRRNAARCPRSHDGPGRAPPHRAKRRCARNRGSTGASRRWQAGHGQGRASCRAAHGQGGVHLHGRRPWHRRRGTSTCGARAQASDRRRIGDDRRPDSAHAAGWPHDDGDGDAGRRPCDRSRRGAGGDGAIEG